MRTFQVRRYVCGALSVAVALLGPHGTCVRLSAESPAPAVDNVTTDAVQPPPARVATPGPAITERLPVPDAAALTAARNLVSQVYGDSMRAVASDSEPLITQLIDASTQTGDLARRYALLLAAEEVAVTGGDHQRAMELVDSRAVAFDVDGLRLRNERLKEFMTPRGKRDVDLLLKLHAHAMATVDRGMQQDDLPNAKDAAELAESAARSVVAAGKAAKRDEIVVEGDERLKKTRDLLKSLDRRSRLLAEHKAALDGLKAAPDDKAANGVVGRYLCLEKSAWPTGLAFLAKGDETDFGKTAAREIELLSVASPDPQAIMRLADAWWRLSETPALPRQAAVNTRSHAASLYQSIIGRLEDPLDIALATRRIGMLETAPEAARPADGPAAPTASTAPQPAASGIDLMTKTNPLRDSIRGQWSRQADGSLLFDAQDSPNGTLEIPFRPAAPDFDLHVEVEVVRGAGNIVLYVPLQGTSRFFILRPNGGENIAYQPGQRLDLEPGKTQRIEVQVRRDGVTVRAGDETLATATAATMRPNSYWSLRHDGAFGIGAHETAVVFRQVRLQSPGGSRSRSRRND